MRPGQARQKLLYLDRADARALTLLPLSSSLLQVRKKKLAGIAGITAYAVGIYFNNKDIARQSKGGSPHPPSLSLPSPSLRGSDLPAPAFSGEGTPQQLLKSVVSQPAKTSCIRLVVVFPRATPKAIAKSLGKAFSSSPCSTRPSH